MNFNVHVAYNGNQGSAPLEGENSLRQIKGDNYALNEKELVDGCYGNQSNSIFEQVGIEGEACDDTPVNPDEVEILCDEVSEYKEDIQPTEAPKPDEPDFNTGNLSGLFENGAGEACDVPEAEPEQKNSKFSDTLKGIAKGIAMAGIASENVTDKLNEKLENRDITHIVDIIADKAKELNEKLQNGEITHILDK